RADVPSEPRCVEEPARFDRRRRRAIREAGALAGGRLERSQELLIRAVCTARHCPGGQSGRPSGPRGPPGLGRPTDRPLIAGGDMEELTRRRLLQISGAAGLTLVTPVRLSDPADVTLAPPRGSLHPLSIRKYVTPLVIPPQMLFTSRGRVDHYEIAV